LRRVSLHTANQPLAIVVEELTWDKVDEMSRRLDNLEATIQASNTQSESDVEK